MFLFAAMLLIMPAAIVTAENTAPAWMDAVRRETLYPAGTYYTGFASAMVGKGEDKAQVSDRVRQNARVEAVSSIQVTVEQTAERYMQNRQSNGTVSTTDIMTSRASTHTGIRDIPGLNTEMWENPKTGEVSAFAWVKVSNLSRRLMRRIAANTASVETEMRNVEETARGGDKMQAKNALAALQTLIDNIRDDQRLMLSIDPSVTDEDLSVEETNSLKARYRALEASLKNGTAVKLVCEADMFGTAYKTLANELKGEIGKLGCTFVTEPATADRVIEVHAAAREYNTASYGSVSTYTVFVDATVSIDKVTHPEDGETAMQRVYEDALTVKGSHTHNYEQAARDAYKTLAQKLGNTIKQEMSRL